VTALSAPPSTALSRLLNWASEELHSLNREHAKGCVVTTNSPRSSKLDHLAHTGTRGRWRQSGRPWTVTRERSRLTRRVGAAELAHGAVELLGPLKLADMPRAGNHYKSRVWDGPLKLVGDAER
jgi:hypothetical protein